MNTALLAAILVAITGVALVAILLSRFVAYLRRLKRDRFIRNFAFPKGLLNKLAARRPNLDLKQRSLVAQGLRQFFLAYLHSGQKYVAMPSQVTDDLWHEFILYTKNYQQFCHHAFGNFLHHTPAVMLGPARADNEGLRRCWWYVCKDENINPVKPLRLPLLFALDEKLGIGDGFRYAANCERRQANGANNMHCGSDFSDGSIDGGTSGFGDSGTIGGADASDSGGGSDGCGGGCGGGD